MKKYLVLIVLFVLPLVAYLFFASGINNFAKLPVLTENIEELELITKKDFNNKISILLFLGNDIENREGDALNLNQKIYKRCLNSPHATQGMDFLIWILFIAVVGLIGLRLVSEEKFNQLKDFLKNRYKR